MRPELGGEPNADWTAQAKENIERELSAAQGSLGNSVNGIATTTGWTGELLQARADMFAARGNPRDLITATTLYLNAIDAGYRRPETLRGLGLSLVKSGQRTEGGKYLKEYLAQLPDAPDARLIQMYIPSSDGSR